VPKPPSVAEAQRAAAFRVALRSFLHRSEEVAREAELTPQWYLLLLLVKGSERGDEEATVGELARRMELAQSTVTELVDRAVRAGLLSRRPSDSDARVGLLRLTPEGEIRLTESFRGLEQERKALQEAIAEL
jgi:DNA-binding MarR family transcriptional regulator